MNDAAATKTVENGPTICDQCEMWSGRIGIALAGVAVFVGCVFTYVLGRGVPNLMGLACVAAVPIAVSATIGVIVGHILGFFIKPPTQPPLIIPPDIEAVARQRFNVPGDTGPQDGVKREGEVSGA